MTEPRVIVTRVRVARRHDHVQALVIATNHALRAIAAEGADMHGTVSLNIGNDHPMHMGETIVEARGLAYDEEVTR